MIAQLDPLLPPTVEPMGPEELRPLVEGLAASPGMWAPRVRHDPAARVLELLWTDQRVDVWLICWSGEDHDTGFHDHDISSRAFAVVWGELVEERLTVGAPVRRRLRRGQSRSFPPSHVHRLQGVGTLPAVSIHAYSPPSSAWASTESPPTAPPPRGRRRHPRAGGAGRPGLTRAARAMSLVVDRDDNPH